MLKDNKKTNIFFVTGGGTGGHIYPAIAVAKALRNDNENIKIYYAGNPNNLEFKIAKEENFDFLPVDITSMPRKFNLLFIKWGFKLFISAMQALYYIFKYRPNAVFGTGGYVSAPAIIAAILSNTPYMIHDSDSHPGIVSRFAAKKAKCVSAAFEEAKKFLKNNNIHVFGNPIKSEFFSVTKEEAKANLSAGENRTLLIMGGSQGSININKTAINCIKFFTEELKINVIIQTGEKNYRETINLLEKIYPDYKNSSSVTIKPYFQNMAIPLKAADLVVSRSGSLSLSEIAAVGIPSILIPYPYAAADHQRKNARCFEQAGASVYIDDFDLNEDIFKKTVSGLIHDEQKLTSMTNSAKTLSRPNAVNDIKKALKEIAGL